MGTEFWQMLWYPTFLPLSPPLITVTALGDIPWSSDSSSVSMKTSTPIWVFSDTTLEEGLGCLITAQQQCRSRYPTWPLLLRVRLGVSTDFFFTRGTSCGCIGVSRLLASPESGLEYMRQSTQNPEPKNLETLLLCLPWILSLACLSSLHLLVSTYVRFIYVPVFLPTIVIRRNREKYVYSIFPGVEISLMSFKIE